MWVPSQESLIFSFFFYQGLFGVVLEGDGHVRAQQTVVENAIAMRMT